MSRGRDLDSAVIQRGLIELNKDIHFDAATKLGAWHPYQATRQGVFYHGIHICSMDRGIVPEFKQWSVVTKYVPVGWDEADKDDVNIQHHVIYPKDQGYMDALIHVMNKDMGWEYRPDGAIVEYTPVAYRKVRGKVVQVGWRHTFERIISKDLPGLTRRAIGEKFGVDMLKFPVGSPQELVAELTEE